VSELRSIADQLRAEPTADLPDARIEDDFVELHRRVQRLEAERLRRLAEIDRRRLFERDGHVSTQAWLVATFKMSWTAARDDVRLARALEEMPHARRALEDEDVSLASVAVLAHAREADPDAFGRAEAELVEAARMHAPSDLQRVTRFWRQSVERERGADPDETLHARRRLHASVSFLGMVRLDGDLDPESGETLLTALRAVLDSEARSPGKDDRTPAQRRADALTEICRQWLDRSDRPFVAGERPHLTVTVAADAFADRTRSAELDHVGPASVELARRIACDGSVMRVVMSALSEPLDVGRRTPVIPPAMRRAVVVRDRGCRFPGCQRPHTWCDAHHVVHWADGGPTASSNLLLLCRRHHRLVHRFGDGAFSLELVEGRPVFRRPDGSVVEDRAPPTTRIEGDPSRNGSPGGAPRSYGGRRRPRSAAARIGLARWMASRCSPSSGITRGRTIAS
jgi:hypothetical protein